MLVVRPDITTPVPSMCAALSLKACCQHQPQHCQHLRHKSAQVKHESCHGKQASTRIFSSSMTLSHIYSTIMACNDRASQPGEVRLPAEYTKVIDELGAARERSLQVSHKQPPLVPMPLAVANTSQHTLLVQGCQKQHSAAHHLSVEVCTQPICLRKVRCSFHCHCEGLYLNCFSLIYDQKALWQVNTLISFRVRSILETKRLFPCFSKTFKQS